MSALTKASSHFAKSVLNEVADQGLSIKASKIVKSHARVGAFFMAVPLFGLGSIISIISLWRMYKKLSDLAQVPFYDNLGRNITAGVIVNIILLFVMDIAFEFIPLLGWIGSGALGYANFIFSGIAYLGLLEELHEEGKVTEKFNEGAF